ELRVALDRFDEDGANRALDRLIAALSVETVMREVLLPLLRILGDRWARGDVSVAQEHFASALLRGRLLSLARGWGIGSGPTLVLACPPGEQHDLGLIMFGIAASRRGRRITSCRKWRPSRPSDPSSSSSLWRRARRWDSTRARSGRWPSGCRWRSAARGSARTHLEGSARVSSRASPLTPLARSAAEPCHV